MVQPDKQDASFENVRTRIIISRPLDIRKDNGPFAVSTGKKSSIEARGSCSKCGVRVGRDDLEACSHCGSLLCRECKRLARNKAKRFLSTAANG